MVVADDKDYLAIASRKCYTVKQKASFRRIHVYARNKKGKTRLCFSAGRDNILITDPEAGTDLMIAGDPFVFPLTKWQDTQELYGALRTGKFTPNHIKQGESSTPFSWVALDGLTRINNMALKYVGKTQEAKDLDRIPGFVQQRDYGKSGELMKTMLINFHTLKMHVVYTSQEKMISSRNSWDDDEESEAKSATEVEFFWVPDLPNAVRAAVNTLAEVTGRLYVVNVENKAGETVKQRRLQIGLHDKYDTGFRSDYALPDMVVRPTLPKLVALMETGEINASK